MAITVQTDGGFWSRAVSNDIAPKLIGGHEGHGLPPGAQALIAPLLLFPATALLPGAIMGGWRDRGAQPGVRFALCWLVPAWIVFELTPTKLAQYTLPLYPALAWLAAWAFSQPLGPLTRRWGAGLSIGVGLIGAGVAVAAAILGGGGLSIGIGVFAAVLALSAGVAGAASMMTRWRWAGLAGALALGVGAHAAIAGALAPSLTPLWLSKRAAEVLDRNHLNPRDGLTPGPVTVVGYAEPSIVFILGTETELGDIDDAAEAISEGRPVVMEARQDAAFRRELAADRLKATPVGSISGRDYSSKGAEDTLIVYRSDSPPPADTPDSP